MKKNLGRKKSRSYEMKGGAGPYVYEGIPLTLENPFTHFAVTSNDDGSYNFNIPKTKNFTSFCELYQYYQQYSPISCVHQEFIGKDNVTRYKAPSFVDILGIALVLRKIQTSERTRIIRVNDKILTEAFKTLAVMTTAGQPLCWKEVGRLHINSFLQKTILTALILSTFESQDVDFMPIVEPLSKLDIDAVLRLFKQAIFFYRYGVINLDASNLLTFERMLTPKDAKTLLTLDPAAIQTFDNNSKQENWFSKISLYTKTPLELALAIQADEPARAQRQAEDIMRNRERMYNKFFRSKDGKDSFDSFNKTYSDVSEGSDEFKRIRRKLLQIQDRMLALGAGPSDGGLLIPELDTPEKIKLQEEYNELRKAAIEKRPPLGGRGRIRVKITNKNRRMRTRRSRTRRTRRRY
jgi:hypothetical protein